MAQSTYDIYKLEKNEDEITLTVFIGQNQQCTSIVKVNEKEIKIAHETFSLKIGKSSNLINSELRVRSLITDIQTDIDIVSETITIDGGVERKSWVLDEKSEDGVTYIFTTVIGFYA